MKKLNDNDAPDLVGLHNELIDSHGVNNIPRQNGYDLTETPTLLNSNMHHSILRENQEVQKRSVLVSALSILFGIGSWIGFTSTFLQLPLLVEKAPEKWSLPSYLVIIGQMANIAPLAYTTLQKYFPNGIKSTYMIFFVKIVGMISSLLTAFLHDKTVLIGGQPHSLALFILLFCLALVGCTSSVLFMPYMGRFRETYLIYYLIGEGLGGFLPSAVTLIQGVGSNSADCILVNTTDGPKYQPDFPPPNFSTRDFYFFVFSIMLSSFLAFLLLENLKVVKKQYIAVTIAHGNNYVYDNGTKDDATNKENIKSLSPRNYKLLLLLMGTICLFGSGILPSIQSYSCLPYGNIAYHLAVSLSAMASPCACFLALFLPHTSMRTILMILVFSIAAGVYTAVTAVLSPNPPLVNSVWGQVLIIISWTCLMGLTSFTKLCITSIMRSQGGKSLVWTGAVSQTGAAVGSVFIFSIINFTNIFVSYDSCNPQGI